MPSNETTQGVPDCKPGTQRGAAVVEFAVIAALVLAIVFGILEYGLVFLQEHYVADAAREGARIGVRANNYDCFGGDIASGFTSCTSDRVAKTAAAVRDYLNILYDPDEVGVSVTSKNLGGDDTGKVLQVGVQVQNFAPGMVSDLLKLLRTGSDADSPRTISFVATMSYEDPAEYDAENE